MDSVATRTLYCGSIWSAEIRLHWSLLLSVPVWFYLFMRDFQLTTGEYLWGISLVACLVLSLLLHECGHLVALRVAKMEVSQVLLHGFGGVTVPARPLRQQLQFSEHKCMAIGNFVAGPTANLVLAALFMVARIVAQASGVEEGPILDFWHGDDISLWLLYASFMNLALALYNLLPIYPLDGGYIFYYSFCLCLEERWARYATSMITLFVAAGVIGVEWTAMSAGQGSILSLVMVCCMCFLAVLMSCGSSYDAFRRHQRLTAYQPVGVRDPSVRGVKPAPLVVECADHVELPTTATSVEVPADVP